MNNKMCIKFLFLSLVLFFIAGCANTSREIKTDQSDSVEGSIQPGLAVLYFEDFFHRHIRNMPTGKAALEKGKPGKPIPYLNHRFGDGPVFDSGLKQGVGVQMTGFIKFPSPGRYLFKTRSNDGVRVFINQKMIIDDPFWHGDGDRFSGESSVDVDQSGWYAFFLQYFQRKGTAMLELYWKMPGDGEFRIVPAEAFGHTP
jgi:hypothetical protein